MEQTEIVRLCLAADVLISSEDLKRVDGGLSVEDLILSKKPVVEEEKETKLLVRQSRQEARGPITPAEVVESYRKRFESLKNILLSKSSAVSINNIRDARAPVTLIGMVRRPSADGFLLEDMTGEIEVRCETPNKLEDDDVVCVKGAVRDGKITSREIILPDIPLLRKVSRLNASAVLVPKETPIDLSGHDVVFTATEMKTSAKSFHPEASPARLSIHKNGEKINMLFYKAERPLGKPDAVAILRKRSLPPATSSASPELLFIEPIPDIFWIIGEGGDWIETYKGVTIVYGSERAVSINLSTRDAVFLVNGAK